MRMRFLSLVMLVPMSAMAQAPSSIDPVLVEALMEQTQQVQSCLAKMDQQELQAWQQRAEARGAEIEALCAAGQQGEAKAKALSFGREVLKSTVFTQLQACSGPLGQFLPQLARATLDNVEGSAQEVCR